MPGLSLVAVSGGHSSSRRADLSLSRPLPSQTTGSRRAGSATVCGSRAQSLRGMWDPPRPGPEPVSPALAGGFPTTAPPGKPKIFFKIKSIYLDRMGFFYLIIFGCVGSSLRCAGFSLRRLLLSQSTGSRARGLSCSEACGIFPDQGSNPCPLHWQAHS